MKAGDVSGGRTSSSEEAWLASPMNDPNAALWASIRPSASASLQTLIRRRADAFSLDVLAERLRRSFPAYFGSRRTAQRGILGAAMALGAGVGFVGYLALGALGTAEAPLASESARAGETPSPTPARAALHAATSPQGGAMDTLASTRVGALDLGEAASAHAQATSALAQAQPQAAGGALADQAALSDPLAQPVTADATSISTKASRKAKRASAWKKKAKARRIAKSRRARATTPPPYRARAATPPPYGARAVKPPYGK